MSSSRNLKLSVEELDKQESLTPERLKKIITLAPVPSGTGLFLGAYDTSPIPKSGIAALTNWAYINFADTFLSKGRNIKIINNRIIIDGQFMHFCDIKKINVECVFSDALISYRSETGAEKFLAQGVFKITAKSFSFLHAALFNHGVQTEEEVFHFIIVNERDTYKYLKFRNDFDSWVKERDGLQEKSGSGSSKKIAGLDRYTTKIKK